MPSPTISPTPERPGLRAGEGAEGGLVGARNVDVEAPPAPRDIRDAVVIKQGDLFLVTNLEGNIPRQNPNGLGLYLADTRFLSAFELAIEGLRPTILLSTSHSNFLSEQVLTNPNLSTAAGDEVPEQTIGIRRYRMLVANGMRESLTIDNLNAFVVRLDLQFRLAADFADMFEVRGLVCCEQDLPPIESSFTAGAVTFRCRGRDGAVRTTRVRFDPAPLTLTPELAVYGLELPPRGSVRLTVTTEVLEETEAPRQLPEELAPPRTARRVPLPEPEHTAIDSSNGLFNAILRQARRDLQTLRSGEGESAYAAAGVPWYATLFGRDSTITALFEVWFAPSLARRTLRLLAKLQSEKDDPWRDAEPGKIIHELRRGELARLGLVPFAPYYGTIDATPLWIILLAEYHLATADVALVRELRPNLEAALTWIDRFGDLDGDGFIEYRRRSASGLISQGWKDSWDAIVRADGELAEPPIALVEAQAYVHLAKRGAARLFRVLGDSARADDLEREAVQLRDRFHAAFWLPHADFYALALDREKRPVDAISSNPGHALFGGIVPCEMSPPVIRRLMDDDLFCGWGIRTLSSREIRYNPAGYHLGTVWPHDNALIALGLKRYAAEREALEIITGMFQAAEHFPSFRMPELFCGFARSAFNVPVRYPVACSPQAWSAAAWTAFVQVMLGLRPNAPAKELRIVRPRLPEWLHWLQIDRLRVGNGEVDLRYERTNTHTAVDVAAMRGNVRVTFVDQWDP